MGALDSLYRGAAIGQSLSKQLGQAQAQDEFVSTQVRANLLQTGVATGKINPASLSSGDTALLKNVVTAGVTPPSMRIPSRGGSVLSNILGAVETPFKIAVNTAGDFASALAGIPQGIATGTEALYKTIESSPIGRATDPLFGISHQKEMQDIRKYPNIGDVGKAIAQSTVHDFTHFDPMHPLYPALDVAAALSGGVGLAGKAGSAAARIGELGSEGSKLRALGDSGRALTQRLVATERPGLINPQALETAQPGTVLPQLPIGYYSLSPFRRFFVEKPIDVFFQSGLANYHIPGMAEGTTLQDIRNDYHIRKIANVTRGRSASTATNEVTRITQPFNHAVHGLTQESGSEASAALKFNALVLRQKLAVDNLSPERALNVLDAYRDRVLATGTPEVEGVANTAQTQAVRKYYRQLTASNEFRKAFSEPTAAMNRVRDAWHEAVLKGLQTLNIDPNEILNRSLGPAAHILNKTPEEMLREQPVLVQSQMNFARGAHDLEQALREHPNDVVQETALIPHIAQFLPNTTPLSDRINLIHDAFNSLSEDIGGHHTRRQLLNNADRTGYLAGNTIAQKVAVGLGDRFGVDAHIAEPYATGGLHNYFPEASAARMKLRPQGGPISRTMERLTRGAIKSGASQVGLYEFKRLSDTRLLKAERLGVAPFESYLQEADQSAFKAGIDRRDPVTFARYISQRERVLAHRLLDEPLVHRLTLKDENGDVLRFRNDIELQNRLGSNVQADKWRLLPYEAVRTLIQSEDQAARDLADTLHDAGGDLTPDVMDHFDQIIDESAQDYDRQLADEVIHKSDGMVALPKTYVDNLVNHARVIDSAKGFGHLWQGFINRWRTAVLAYMPSWLLRTSMGHGVVLYIGGVWDPAFYNRAISYFGNGYKIPGTDVHLSRGENRIAPAGIEQGSPHEDFGRFGMQRTSSNKIAYLTTHGVHNVANFQRRAAFLTFLHHVEREQQWNDLGHALKVPEFLKTEHLDRVIADHPEWVHHALNELDRVSYTFGQMAPWERRLAKNYLPFWGWYKFVSKFVWSLPMTYPGRALALSRLGGLGNSELDSLGAMPEWLRSSLMFDTHNLAAVHYISTLGLNPLGDVADPAHGIQGLVRLGQMSPVIQAALEGAGYNTMTGGLEMVDPSSGIVEVNGKYVNLNTGKEADSPDAANPIMSAERVVGGLLRSFPEIRIGEQALTGGRPIYPESIPILNEKIIPSKNPPKDVSPIGIALQYLGVAPKTYNLQKYQVNLLNDITRARGQFYKAVAKEKAMK